MQDQYLELLIEETAVENPFLKSIRSDSLNRRDIKDGYHNIIIRNPYDFLWISTQLTALLAPSLFPASMEFKRVL